MVVVVATSFETSSAYSTPCATALEIYSGKSAA